MVFLFYVATSAWISLSTFTSLIAWPLLDLWLDVYVCHILWAIASPFFCIIHFFCFLPFFLFFPKRKLYWIHVSNSMCRQRLEMLPKLGRRNEFLGLFWSVNAGIQRNKEYSCSRFFNFRCMCISFAIFCFSFCNFPLLKPLDFWHFWNESHVLIDLRKKLKYLS